MKQLLRISMILFSSLILFACGQGETTPSNESLPFSSKEFEMTLKTEPAENTVEPKQDDTEKIIELEIQNEEQTDLPETKQITEEDTVGTKKGGITATPKLAEKKQPTKEAAASKGTNQATDEKSIPSVETKPETPPTQTEPKATVTISVEKPSDVSGPSVSAMRAEIQDGDTVLTVSKRALSSQNITINSIGSGATAYVKGIGGLEEFDEGPLSGWNVYVNNTMISKSSDASDISNGDSIHWVFTKNHLAN